MERTPKFQCFLVKGYERKDSQGRERIEWEKKEREDL
jgi:hypothetical protein